MESGNDGVSSKGFLIPVPDSSDVFEKSVLAPLRSANLYEESKQCFRYNSAFLVKNPALEEKYNNFRANWRQAGYSEEELEESYGFLLFEDFDKAIALGEKGVPTGNNTCTILGDPKKGIYISMYSDCLDVNGWYNGRTGYIAIIRLTKGKVIKVLENYAENFTEPTVGFDCHVSKELDSVSSKSSAFVAFERSQYYMYELLNDGSNKPAQSPSAACPVAIVSCSYTDTKATLVTPQVEKSEVRKIGCPYLSWRGELQIGSHSYHVGLRSTAGAFIPAELPPVVKVDKVISMVDLRHLLPKAVFETFFTGEALLDGFYCSLCVLVFSEIKEKSSIDLLLEEINRKDVALIIPLSDGGFLILLHSSPFLAYNDFVTDVGEILQGVFVFSHSRVPVRDTKVAQRHPPIATEILRCLSALTYAEGEVKKTAFDPSDELRDVVAQHMQSYAVLINPGLESVPSREDGISPCQYDDDLQHLDLSPAGDIVAWQSMKSYLSKPASFQLPLSEASRALDAGPEEQEDELEDIPFICHSSPEIGSPMSKLLENQSPDKMEAINLDASLDCGASSSEAHTVILPVQKNVGLALQAGNAAKDRGQYVVLTAQSETNDMEAKNLPPTSNDLPTELIVSITSADQSVGVATLSVGRNISTTKPNDFKISDLQSCNDESDKSGNVVKGCKLSKPYERILQSSPLKGQTPISAACVETTSLQTCRTPKDLSDNLHLKSHSNTVWKKGFQGKWKFEKMSLKSNEKRLDATDSASAEEKSSDCEWHSLGSSILMELEAYPLRKKTERWDLKPVISESGRILVPFGSVDIANQIISIKKQKQARKREPCLEKVMVGVSSKADDTEEMKYEGSGALETLAVEKGITNSVDGRDHQLDPDLNIFELLNDGGISVPSNDESHGHLVNKDDTDLPPSQALQEKRLDTISTVKLMPNSKSLLSKLQSVILKGKRKGHFLLTEELTENTVEDMEPFLKKGRMESDTETLKGNHLTTLVAGAGVQDVSSMMPVELFAYGLGLTPKETHGRLQRAENKESLQGDDSAEAQRQNLLDKLPQGGHRPLSSFSRRGRIKTLKKHQGVSEECIKKEWWLHFQTPACNAIEKVKCKDCTKDNSVKKSLQEKLNNAGSSADGLNLLADLALSASSDQVSPQSHPALERKPETSLKKGDITKSLAKTDQESFLHTLLRQHNARATQLPGCCSPSQPVGDRELVDLLLREHAYSFPPSSSLLLGLPGTPLPVCPVSGSTRLLPHQQAVYGDRIKARHPPVGQEDQRELNRTEEHMKKYKMVRQNFRHSRTFGGKGGSLQVTRQWHENYNFDQDSKFTSDMKNKAINRGLHGPWDFSIADTNEEVRLIIHMWISLFYSRSTARFFHIDPNFTYPCSEKYDFLEIPHEVALSTAETELKESSNVHTSEPLPPKALDLSKKHNLDSGQDAVVLDLSLTNFTAETVLVDPHRSKKESSLSNELEGASEVSNVPKSPGELHKANTYQSRRKFGQSSKHSPTREGNDVKSIHQITTDAIQSAVFVQHRNVSPMSFQSGRSGRAIHPQKTKNAEIDTRSGQMFRGCNRENNGKSGNAEDQLMEKDQVDLSKLVADIKKYREAGDRQPEMGLKDDKSSEIKQDQSQEVIVEPASEQLHIICSGLENQMPDTKKKPKRNSLDQAEINEDVDSCPRHEAEAIKSDEHARQICLDKKDRCISAAEELDRDLGDQLVPANSDDIVLAQGKDTKERTDCVKMDEQGRAENITVACYDLLINTACSDGMSLTDESAATELVPHTPSELLPIDEDFSSENSPEKDACVTDHADVINKVLPMCAEITSFSAAISIPKTKYDAAMETHRNLKSDFPFDVNGKEREHQKTSSADEQKESKNSSQVLIPFLEMDLLGDDALQPEDSLPQHTTLNNEEIVQDREEMPLVTKTTYTEAVLPNEVHGTFQSKTAEPSSLKLPLHAESEADQPVEWDGDHRCPTPTIDEKPYENISSGSDGSVSTFTDGKMDKNITQTYSSTPNEIPEDQQLCKSSAVRTDCSSPVGIHLDVEARTIQVLQSVKNLLSMSNHSNKPFKIKKADMKDSLAETSDHRSYNSHSVAALKREHSGENISNFCKAVVSTECLQANKPNADQQVYQTKSKSHVSHESLSDCQRPVMTVKPSKSNESQVSGLSENPCMNNSFKNKHTSAPVVTSPSIVSEKTMKELPPVKSKVEERFKASELSSIDSWLMNYRSNLDKAEFDIVEPSREYPRRNSSSFNRSSSSSQSMQILEPAKSVSHRFDGNQGFLRCSTVEDVEKGTEKMTQMDHAEHSHTSASFVTRKDKGIMEDALLLRPQTSLACTTSNTSPKRPITFLEQLSNRCRQVDLTQASLEQECLIFSEKMKQLPKKIKKRPLRQQEPLDTLRSSCIGPLTVHFSSLEEQDDSHNLLDTSLLGQKIKVDMSNRKTVNSTKEIHSSHSKESSQRASDLVEYSVVSDVTTECTRLYEAAMDDICAVKKPPSRSKRTKMDESLPKAGPSNHFDFCDQMKREIDETFRSQLNSVVKKSCKTKYRFFILWTSDDVFFDETKAQLEAEGHTAVNPSEFFAGERLSSLLIILRNEDIAEHICQIPRLLELKRSSNVLFAGIDEPDDVINLTHQELFTRGGFTVIDKAAMESLSLYNMRKIFQILHELNKNVKWKWMLHYRDSRRLKEDARLSAEAKEKKNFLQWGQEAGILEVLPYHECDLMSRDQPDYLSCLLRLQIQNISSRYCVFITDTKTDGVYERNGILMMTLNSFLRKASSEIFSLI